MCRAWVILYGSNWSGHPETWLKEEANRLFRALCSHVQCIWGWGLARRCYHWRRARLAFSNQKWGDSFRTEQCPHNGNWTRRVLFKQLVFKNNPLQQILDYYLTGLTQMPRRKYLGTNLHIFKYGETRYQEAIVLNPEQSKKQNLVICHFLKVSLLICD